MKVIPKNTKKAREVFETAQKCMVYSSETGYFGREGDVERARQALYDSSRARLWEVDPGRYCVRLSGALWYDLFDATYIADPLPVGTTKDLFDRAYQDGSIRELGEVTFL